MFDYTFGLSFMTWVGIAIVCGVLGFQLIKLGLTDGMLKGLKVAFIASLLIASVVGNFWVASDDGSTGTLDIITEEGDWDWVHSSGDAASFSVHNNTTVTGDRALLVTFLATGGATVDEATINIDYVCTRIDTNIDDDVATITIVSVGSVTNITTGMTYSILAKNAAGDYDTAIDDGTSTFQDVMSMNFPSDPSARTDTLGLQLEVNVLALNALASYGVVTIVVDIDGVQDTISIMRQ